MHVLVVGLVVAASFATASLASEESPPMPEAAAASQPARPLLRSEPQSAQAAFPAYVPPPQAQVASAGPVVIQGQMAPPAPCVDDPAHPTFCVYTVQPGDTLSGIAVTYGISGNDYLSAVEMLAQSNKPDVISSDQIVPGQKLRLPKRTGIIHTVFSTRTLSEIAELYGVTIEAVIAVPENGVDADGHIDVGQDLLIPDPQHLPPEVEPELPPIPEPTPEPELLEEDAPEPVEPPPVDTPEPVETAEPQETEQPEPEETEEPAPEETPEPDQEEDAQSEDEIDPGEDPAPVVIVSDLGDRPSETSVYGFVWPAWGRISSYFGPGHPLGIDIDVYGDPNSPIGAAKAGIVTFAGGNACCSYGLYVIVEHGDGTSTLYAHLSQIAVVQGQAVSTGQLLGFAGATGYATGNHLHFEVRIGDAVVDPLIFLPPVE